MIFGDLPLDQAEGAILAHSRRLPGRSLPKGRVLSAEDIMALRESGATSVIAARLEADDVREDEAATRVAAALVGPGLVAGAPFTGRVNLFATAAGVVSFDPARIDAFNLLDESITVATLPRFAAVEPRQMVATIKIIPFAAPRTAVEQCVRLAGNAASISVSPFRPRRVGLIQTQVAGTKASVLDKTTEVTRSRLEALGSELIAERRCGHDQAQISVAIGELRQGGCEMLLIAGASAIVDRRDVVPAAIVDAGGTVDHFGMPVDPGNLMLLAHIADTPVLGLPGCARSPKYNGFDQILQRMMADIALRPQDVMRMGVGGLLAEIPTRPQPRAEKPKGVAVPTVPHAPRVAALVLAAGRSTRMGDRNKLLTDVGGKPMLIRTLEAVLMAQVASIQVVVGHQAEEVRAAVAQAFDSSARITFVDNPNYAEGLSTSLRAGLAAIPDDADAVLICLGDMPAIGAAQIDRLIAAFNPVESRSICVPTYGGKRGNPILWARRFVPDMMTVAGDVGARHLIGENAEAVCEVEMGDEGVLIDLDTPEALAHYVGGLA